MAGSEGRVQQVSGRLGDDARRGAIYAGELLVFITVAPMRELCALTDGLIRDALGVPDPERAQERLDPTDLAVRTAELRRTYRAHPDARRLFLAALARVGVDVGHTCWDRLYLRMAPTADSSTGNRPDGERLGVHRDT